MRQSGFTLVELSIVLVIIGLLVGGIMVGQTLVRASELRGITKDFDQFSQGAMAFRDKYFALPGDMTNANSVWTSEWYTLSGSTLTSTSTASLINGNGDRMLWWTYVSPGDRDGQKFFAHLRQAGFATGTPVVSSNNLWCNPGVNVPTALKGGYTVDYNPTWGANYILLGAADTTGNGPCVYPLITATEAFDIDTKIDDGIPNVGKIRETNVYPGNSCTNAGVTTYNSSSASGGTVCRVFYLPSW